MAARTKSRKTASLKSGDPKSKVTITCEYVTPQIAKQWLDKHNKRNRKQNRGNISQISRAIQDDEWIDIADVVRFDVDGKLVDAQHRLESIIRTGRSLWMWVARGLDRKAFRVVDQGAPRQLGDMFCYDGEKNYYNLATAVRYIWILGCDRPMSRLTTKLNIPHAYSILERHGGVRESVRLMDHLGARHVGSVGVLAGFHYATKKDPFWERVVSGEDLKRNRGDWALRNKLLTIREGVDNLDRSTILAICLKGWNSYMQGMTVAKINVTERDYNATLIKPARGGVPRRKASVNGKSRKRSRSSKPARAK